MEKKCSDTRVYTHTYILTTLQSLVHLSEYYL